MPQRKIEMCRIFGKEPETMDELAECVIATINSKIKKESKVIGFSWDLNKHDCISNTHCSPVGYKTNWSGRDASSPRGYPGWCGRVWIRYEHHLTGYGNDPFSSTLTHPGTGGGGSYNGPWENIAHRHFKTFGHKRHTSYPRPELYSWDYKLFDYDWPEVTSTFNKDKVFSILADEIFIQSHKFLWNDPATVEKDKEFIDSLVVT